MSKSWTQKRQEMRFAKHAEALQLSHVEPLYREIVKQIKDAVETRVGDTLSENDKQELIGVLVHQLGNYCVGYAWAKAQVLKAAGHYTYQITTEGT